MKKRIPREYRDTSVSTRILENILRKKLFSVRTSLNRSDKSPRLNVWAYRRENLSSFSLNVFRKYLSMRLPTWMETKYLYWLINRLKTRKSANPIAKRAKILS